MEKAIPLQHLQRVMRRYQEGDAEAFAEFYHLTKRALFSHLMMRLANRQDAEDSLQDVYIKIHKNIRSWNPELGTMSWLLTITYHVAVDCLRRRRSSMALPLNLEDIRQAEQGQARDELQEILAKLSDEEEKLLCMRFLENQSFEEMSAEMQQKSASLRQKVSRLLRSLRGSR